MEIKNIEAGLDITSDTHVLRFFFKDDSGKEAKAAGVSFTRFCEAEEVVAKLRGLADVIERNIK